MDRRRFLAGITGATLTGMAGCTGSSNSGEPGEGSNVETPSEQDAINVVENYFQFLSQGDTEGVNSLRHPDSSGDEISENEMSQMAQYEFEVEEITVSSLEDEKAIVNGMVTVLENSETIDESEFELELRVSNGEWKIWVPSEDEDTNGSDESESGECSDAIRILSEFEDFPDGGTYPEGEPSEAKLQISFENTASTAVEYEISATFIEFSSRRRRSAGTTSGVLESGGTASYEFVYTGTPQTIVEIDDYELTVNSSCR